MAGTPAPHRPTPATLHPAVWPDVAFVEDKLLRPPANYTVTEVNTGTGSVCVLLHGGRDLHGSQKYFSFN